MVQIQFETDTSKRLLLFLMEENIRMKIRLSDVLKESFTDNLLDDLEHLEYFQNQFIKMDNFIALMRHELAELETLPLDKSFDKTAALKLGGTFKVFRKNILQATRDFFVLVADFNDFLLENGTLN